MFHPPHCPSPQPRLLHSHYHHLLGGSSPPHLATSSHPPIATPTPRSSHHPLPPLHPPLARHPSVPLHKRRGGESTHAGGGDAVPEDARNGGSHRYTVGGGCRVPLKCAARAPAQPAGGGGETRVPRRARIFSKYGDPNFGGVFHSISPSLCANSPGGCMVLSAFVVGWACVCCAAGDVSRHTRRNWTSRRELSSPSRRRGVDEFRYRGGWPRGRATWTRRWTRKRAQNTNAAATA